MAPTILGEEAKRPGSAEAFWQESCKRGIWISTSQATSKTPLPWPAEYPSSHRRLKEEKRFSSSSTTIQFFDGRVPAPFLQELPTR